MGTAGRKHGDDKPQMIKGLMLLGPRGAARAFYGTVLGNGGPAGPSCGLHSWLEGEQEEVVKNTYLINNSKEQWEAKYYY